MHLAEVVTTVYAINQNADSVKWVGGNGENELDIEWMNGKITE